MPRKKDDAEDIELVPEETFEDAMRAVLKADRAKVSEQLEAMQASNKAKRDAREPKE